MARDEQRQIHFGRPWITDAERSLVAGVLDSHVLTQGQQCRSFEHEFARLVGPDAHCVAVSSCMAALHLALVYFRLSVGDEVLVPAQTHVATVHAVEWAGATPVFVDCDPATGNVTAEAIEAAVTARTRAICVVHYAGIPCDMPAIMRVASRHGLKVLEDCALAVGARIDGAHVGTFGDAGAFSFYPTKHITTGEGGMLVTRDRELAAAVARGRAFGVERSESADQVPGQYDVPVLGLNYRMNEMAAALGRAQLARIEENLARRRVNFETLRRELNHTHDLRVLNSTSPARHSSHYCLSAILEGEHAALRDDIVHSINAAGVGTSVYYPHPTPRLRYYRQRYGWRPERFPNAVRQSDASFALPVGPHLGPSDITFMIDVVRAAIATDHRAVHHGHAPVA